MSLRPHGAIVPRHRSERQRLLSTRKCNKLIHQNSKRPEVRQQTHEASQTNVYKSQNEGGDLAGEKGEVTDSGSQNKMMADSA